MTEEERVELRKALEKKKMRMNTFLDSGDRTEYITVESEIYELKKQIGEPLSDW
ncbi:MAG: hypothetical protein U9M90_02150 [Patescibacteria group bacterium]|nr:hypothetical protein [Patescibacteria group bacterium]